MASTRIKPESLQSICVVRLSALGDCFLLVPLIHTLRVNFPQAKITWIIERQLAPLFTSLEGVELIPINKPKSPKDYRYLRTQFADREFDLLIAAQASLRVNLIYPCIKAKVKLGFDKQRARDLHQWFVNERISPKQEHLLDGFLGFAKHLGIDAPTIEWPLQLAPEATAWAEKELAGERYIAINPAASKLERTPQASFYQKLIEQILNTTAYHILLTGGPSDMETELASEVASANPQKIKNLTGKTSLVQLTALMAAVDLLIAPDTGPAHIATAFGTPVIGLYAVAPPELSGPYLSQELVINKFPEAVTSILGKDPATIPWGTRVHDREAMDLIQIEEVMEKLTQVLNDQSNSTS